VHRIVKATRLEYGEETNDDSWHLVDTVGGCDVLFCTGDAFTEGDIGKEGEYEIKEVKRGGITCKTCLEHLRVFKAIKL
jgi:hypothetical protein